MIALLSIPLASAALPAFLQGKPSGIGAGLQVGSLTGIAVSARPGGELYFQGAVNWSLTENRLNVDGDVLWTITELVIPDSPRFLFPVYFGAGGRVRMNQKNEALPDNTFGARIPIGMAMTPADTSLDVFFELAPVLEFYPDIRVTMEAALGVRIYPFSRQ